MAKKPSTRLRPVRPPTDGEGNGIGNKILLGLSSKECVEVVSKLELVRLKLHQVLYEAGETIKSGYFVNSGMMSVLAVQGKLSESASLVKKASLVCHCWWDIAAAQPEW